MRCELLCFLKKNLDLNFLLDTLETNYKQHRIITNDFRIYDFLENKNIDIKFFGSFFSEQSSVSKEIYQKAKKYQKEYSKIFQNLIINEMEIFRGIEFQLLLQLILIIKAQILLEDKKDTVFIFNRFSPAYFAIIKNAACLNYIVENRIGIIEKNKIEYFGSKFQIGSDNFENISKKIRINFISSYFGKTFSKNNFKSQSQLFFKVLLFLIRKNLGRIIYKNYSASIEKFLKKLDGKLKKSVFNNQAQCAIFISATRLDLYLRPIVPVLKKLETEKIPYQIIVGDMATGLALSKEGFSFINLFEEINILSDMLKNDKESIFEKRIQEISKSRTIMGFNELLPDLLNKTYRSIATIIILEHIIEKMNLKSIITTPTGQLYENLAIEVAKKFKITSFSFVPSPSDPYAVFADWFHADKLFVDGIQGVELLTELGYDKNKTIISGSTKFDYLKTLSSQRSKRVLEKNHNIDSEKKLISIILSRWRKNDEIWVSKFIDFCNKNNFEVVIKIHPYYKLNQMDRNKNFIQTVEKNCKNLKFLITFDIDAPILLSASDLVITEQSTLGLEAIFLEKNLIMVKFADFEMDRAVRFYEYDAALSLEKYSDLEKVIFEIFFEKKHIKSLKNGRNKVIKRYNFQNDGKATERVYKELIVNL